MKLTEGKKYRVTATLELVNDREGFRIFRDSDGDTVALSYDDTVFIDPEPWEVRTGDVYLRNGDVYHVKDVSLHGATFRAGDASNHVTRDMNFTEDELIHRESQ